MRHVEQAECGGVGQGFTEVGDHRVDAVEGHLVGDAQFVMLGAQRLGGPLGVGEFVDAMGETDREGGCGAGAVGQRRGEAGVDASGQERALFHLAGAVNVHRVGDGGPNLVDVIIKRPTGRFESGCPPAVEGGGALGVHMHVVAGGEFGHPGNGGVGLGDVLEGEKPQHGLGPQRRHRGH